MERIGFLDAKDRWKEMDAVVVWKRRWSWQSLCYGEGGAV